MKIFWPVLRSLIAALTSIIIYVPAAMGQWSPLPVVTTQHIHSVDYASSGDIWLGSNNRVFFSNNGGTNFTQITPIKDPNNVQIIGTITDLIYTGGGSAAATGLFYLGNDELLLHTSNNGTTWDMVSSNNTVGLPRFLNALDRSGNNMIATGNNGRIAHSANNGVSWNFVSSGTSAYIADVKYLSADTVLAAGDAVILRSVNGGQTWSVNTGYPGFFHTVSAGLNKTYITAEYSDILLRSADNGLTFDSILLPFETSGAMFAISDDTLLLTSDTAMYITRNGGQHWEYYNIPSFQPVYMIDVNGNNAIAVGENGFAIRHNTISASTTLPVADFSFAGPPYCTGTTLSLTNHTVNVPGYTYEWKLDNQVFNNQYNAVLNMTTAGSYTITLRVTNSAGSVTISKPITIIGHDLTSFTVNPFANTVCTGSRASFIIPNSQTGVTYQLRKGFTSEGAAVTGNGDTITFNSTSPVLSSTVFNIKAIKSNVCFTDSLIEYITIDTLNSSLKPLCIPTATGILGISNFTLGSINNSSVAGNNIGYTDFSCLYNTPLVVGQATPLTVTVNHSSGRIIIWIDLDSSGTFTTPAEEILSAGFNNVYNGTITIPASYQLFNVPLRLRIGYSWTGNSFYHCASGTGVEFEDYSVTVVPAPVAPVASFTPVPTVTCNTSILFNNTTYNATSYQWDFGDGTTSTVLKPTHIYTTSGTYTVTLIAVNTTGSDTISQQISINNPLQPVPAQCSPTAYTLSCTFSEIAYVGIQGLTQQHSSTNGLYEDYTCTKQFNLIRGNTYTMAIGGTGNCTGWISAWVDFNGNGVFTDTLERIIPGAFGMGCPATLATLDIPDLALLHTPLRMRILSHHTSTITGPCMAICGQYEEYSIILDTLASFFPGFTVSKGTTCINSPVQFTNTSINASIYSWNFGDGNTSSLENPVHAYTSPGIYNVKLTVCDSVHCDSIIQFNVVTVYPLHFSQTATICPGQSFSVGSNTYTAQGTYTDTLTASYGCDSIMITTLNLSSFSQIILNPAGNVSICRGDSVVITAPPGLSSWQWYRNGILIPGASQQSYTAKIRGNYNCAANHNLTCRDTSVTTTVNVTCLSINPPAWRNMEELNKIPLDIFPNPGQTLFKINSPAGFLRILNELGQEMLSWDSPGGTHETDLGNLPAGIYFLQFKADEAVSVRRFIILKN
jgi:PKD repeat protein